MKMDKADIPKECQAKLFIIDATKIAVKAWPESLGIHSSQLEVQLSLRFRLALENAST